jgi:hypothetical protein
VRDSDASKPGSWSTNLAKRALAHGRARGFWVGASVVVLLMMSCGLIFGGPQGADADNPQLTANPNPVPVAQGATQGTTQINWNTGSQSNGVVQENHGGSPQTISNSGSPSGTTSATVLCGQPNNFTLFPATSTQPLSTLSVTCGGAQATATASPSRTATASGTAPSQSFLPSYNVTAPAGEFCTTCPLGPIATSQPIAVPSTTVLCGGSGCVTPTPTYTPFPICALSGCGTPTTSGPSLTANPASVSAGSQSQGTTTLSWNTGNGDPGQVVYIDPSGNGATLSPVQSQGSAQAPVYCGATNAYTLHDYNTGQALKTLTIEITNCPGASTPAVLTADPNPVDAGGNTQGTTRVTWNTNNGDSGDLTFYPPSGPPMLIQSGPSPGSWYSDQTVPCGGDSTFTLTDTSSGTILASVKVVINNCPGTTLTLPGGKILTSQAQYVDCDSSTWGNDCSIAAGAAPVDPGSLTASKQLEAGFSNSLSGFPGASGWYVYDDFYRGGIGFDMDQASQFISAHGLRNAYLDFEVVSGDMGCVGSVQYAINDGWNDPAFGIGIPNTILPASDPTNANPVNVFLSLWHADVGNTLLTQLPNGTLHFVFIGTDETQPAFPGTSSNTSNSCTATLGNFTLDLIGDH